jgi:hypothetical protein
MKFSKHIQSSRKMKEMRLDNERSVEDVPQYILKEIKHIGEERNIGDGGFKEVVEVIKDEQNGNGSKLTSYSAHPPWKDSDVAKYCRIKEKCGHGRQRMAGVVKKNDAAIINRLENFPITVNCGAHDGAYV